MSKIERICDWLDEHMSIGKRPGQAILVLALGLTFFGMIVVATVYFIVQFDKWLEVRVGWPAAAAFEIFVISYIVACFMILINRR